MNGPREADVLKACLDYLRLRRIPAWRQNQGAVAGEHKGKRRFLRFAAVDGISDILGLLPPSGRLLAVECKRPGGKLSAHQQVFLKMIEAAGGLALCVDDVRQLQVALEPSCPASAWPSGRKTWNPSCSAHLDGDGGRERANGKGSCSQTARRRSTLLTNANVAAAIGVRPPGPDGGRRG